MAVEIPVYVDIMSGIDEAIKKQLPKAVDEMQVAVSRNALQLKFQIDQDGSKKSLRQILDDTTLSAEQLSRALADVNRQIRKRTEGGGFKGKGGKYTNSERSLLEAKSALEAKAQILAQAEAAEKAAKSEEKLDDANKKVDESNKKVRNSSKGVNNELKTTNNKLATLIKNSIRLIALHSATRFLDNIRKVTSEFEMQRVALAGIIQDTAQAESLFKRLKAAAIQSPFEIKDLVTFTKQLSAYRIETDKLFDVTMKLADVSAGLGVDMSRLVLAYGQVRAASVLRGQELRQFTEAGIPLVELLAEKFTTLNGRMVSTAEVFELISKRAVPFSMIEEIFNDMTNAGGMFYKMQEKQSETLLGQWMKLKDALSIMYDEIGNVKDVHEAMESGISIIMKLAQNWRLVAGSLAGVGAGLAVVEGISVFIPKFTRNTTLARKAWVGLVNAFKSASTWVGLIATAIGALVGYLVSARREATRLNKEISEARVQGSLQVEQSLRNFKRLADAAVSAAQGSYEQREALKELQRTYGDIIPSQDMEIERLRELKGNYDLLTAAIQQKIEMQVHEQNLNRIQETYGNQLAGIQKSLKKSLIEDAGLSSEEAARYISAVMDAVRKGLIDATERELDIFIKLRKIAAEQIGDDKDWQAASVISESSNFWGRTYFSQLLKVLPQMNDALEKEDSYFKSLNNSLGKYSDIIKELRKNSQRAPEGFTLDQAGTFEYNQALWKQRLEDYKKTLTQIFEDVDISEAFEVPDTINFEKIIDKIGSGKGTQLLKKAVNEIQKDYLNFAPQENTTRLVTEAAIRFADAVGISMTRVQGYLKQDSQQMDDYAKSVKGFLDSSRLQLQTKEFEQKNWTMMSNYARPTDEDIENEKQEVLFLEKLLEFVQEFLKQKGGGGSGQDPWIILIKNRMKFMQDFQKGVEDLDKFMAHSTSLGREQGIMKGRGLSVGIDTSKLRGDAEELRKWYSDAIDSVVDKIQSLGGKQFSGLGVTEILAKDLTGRKLQKYQELLQELWKGLTDFDTAQLRKSFEDSLKRIKDEIKRSETARDFYQDILGLTGDEELATSMSISVYGSIGDDFKDRIKKELVDSLNSLDAKSLSGLDEAIRKAFETGDYESLAKNIEKVPENLRATVQQVAADAEKFSADQIRTWIKELAQFKTYGEKRVQLAKQTAQRIEEVNASDLPKDQKDSLVLEYQRKEAEEAAKLQYEAFKDTPMYIHLFENLDAASTKMLTSMRDNLIRLKENWKDLDPTQLREMQKRIEEIDSQLAAKNPFKAIADGIRAYREQTKGTSREEIERNAILDQDVANAQKDYLAVLTEQYEALEKSAEATDEEKDAAKQAMEAQAVIADKAQETANASAQTANNLEGTLKSVAQGAENVEKWTGAFSGLGSSVKNLMSEVLSDEDAEAFAEQFDGVMGVIDGLSKSGAGISKILKGDFTGVIDIVSGVVDSIASIFAASNAAKVRRANKAIEDQQKIIDKLERSYQRLEDAMDEAFGTDYLYNYRKELEIINAEVAAYRAQAAAERSKGKKADEDKALEYERQAEDAMERIKEATKEMQSFFAGSDLASAAQDFSSAWLDAYREFGNTAGAIEERMEEMVKNLVEKAALSSIVQNVMGDWYESLKSIKDWNAQAIAEKVAEARKLIPVINQGLNTAAAELQAAGVSLRGAVGQFTGISRDYAAASEESINGLAAGVNTQNFFLQHLDMNVAAILSVLTGGASTAGASVTGEAVDPYKDQMLLYASHLPTIDANLAELLTEVRRVIKPSGNKYAVQVQM